MILKFYFWGWICRNKRKTNKEKHGSCLKVLETTTEYTRTMQNIPESPTDEENHVVVTTADKEFSFRAQHWQVKLLKWHFRSNLYYLKLEAYILILYFWKYPSTFLNIKLNVRKKKLCQYRKSRNKGRSVREINAKFNKISETENFHQKTAPKTGPKSWCGPISLWVFINMGHIIWLGLVRFRFGQVRKLEKVF